MGFSRQEYWSGVPLPSPGDLPHPGIETGSPTLEADALLSEPPGKSEETEGQRKSRAPEEGDELFPILSEASGLIYLNLNGDGAGA